MARPKFSLDKNKRKPRKPIIAESLIGKKFNRWTVLGIVSLGKNVKLNVLCDCGTQAIRNMSTIAYLNSQSCGCFHKEQLKKRQIKPDKFAAKRRLYNSYKFGAKTRNINFLLKLEQVVNIATKNCYYCNIEPQTAITTTGGTLYYNGIDRVDNTVGYILENCVPCCWKCNNDKGAVSINIIKKVYEKIYGK